jgi:multiple sugar transport system permease protein
MIFIAAILGMPREPFEAAEVEGANRWHIFRHITLPLLRPIIIVALLLRLTDAFKTFDQVFIMTGGGPGASTELATIFAYKVNFASWNLGYGSAVVTLLFFIGFVLTFVMLKLMTRFGGRSVS